MKTSFKKLWYVLLAVSLFVACKKDDHPANDPEPETPEEFLFIRLIISDAANATITQVAPVDGKTTAFDARYSNATLYATGSKRFGALLHGTQNLAEFFDTGLELHDDHVDIKGTAKFAAITGTAPKPTHFKSRRSESLIFNDGDGTLSSGIESDFHIAGAKMKIINAGLDPHHGAMAQFDNNTYAVTFVDKSSAKAGPHGVKIINGQGATIHASTVAVSRLHGNATDGTNAVFGVEGGVLVVTQSGAQRMIANPGDWGTTRLGTILEAAGAKKFLGFVATKGIYDVDITANRIIPILESTDIMQAKTDFAGNNLHLLMHDGTLKIYDLKTMALKKEGKVISATPSSETLKPVLEATSKYAYITMPSLGEVHQVKLEDLTTIKKIKAGTQPSKLVILGFETNESH